LQYFQLGSELGARVQGSLHIGHMLAHTLKFSSGNHLGLIAVLYCRQAQRLLRKLRLAYQLLKLLRVGIRCCGYPANLSCNSHRAHK
jgi:hypothetical protein